MAATISAAERQQLHGIIQQWNENRLDLFSLTEPSDDLEFHGVMRFYFQDPGARVATKCVRVSSTATTRAVVEALIEKFHPDIRMLTTPDYALWEVHESGEERKLRPEEKPLLVQLNWHKDDREGRFVLKTEGAVTLPIKTMQELDQIDAGLRRRLSKRERKEVKKAAQRARALEAEDAAVARRIYADLPETNFTRTISNPEIVMKKRRERKLESKLREMSDDPFSHGGSLRIYGASIDPHKAYVTLLLTIKDNAATVLRDALDKYNVDKWEADDFCLLEVYEAAGSAEDMQTAAHERVLLPHECPLVILSRYATDKASVTFHLRRRRDVGERSNAAHTRQANQIHPVQSQLPPPKAWPSPQREPMRSSQMPSVEIVNVTFRKLNGGIGLSIVAAQDPLNRDQLAIYLKKVIAGGAADRDGRLQIGDQLHSVNSVVLSGLTQEQAAGVLASAGDSVSFQVGKRAAYNNGVASYLKDEDEEVPRVVSPPPAYSRPSTTQHRSSHSFDQAPNKPSRQPAHEQPIIYRRPASVDTSRVTHSDAMHSYIQSQRQPAHQSHAHQSHRYPAESQRSGHAAPQLPPRIPLNKFPGYVPRSNSNYYHPSTLTRGTSEIYQNTDGRVAGSAFSKVPSGASKYSQPVNNTAYGPSSYESTPLSANNQQSTKTRILSREPIRNARRSSNDAAAHYSQPTTARSLASPVRQLDQPIRSPVRQLDQPIRSPVRQLDQPIRSPAHQLDRPIESSFRQLDQPIRSYRDTARSTRSPQPQPIAVSARSDHAVDSRLDRPFSPVWLSKSIEQTTAAPLAAPESMDLSAESRGKLSASSLPFNNSPLHHVPAGQANSPLHHVPAGQANSPLHYNVSSARQANSSLQHVGAHQSIQHAAMNGHSRTNGDYRLSPQPIIEEGTSYLLSPKSEPMQNARSSVRDTSFESEQTNEVILTEGQDLQDLLNLKPSQLFTDVTPEDPRYRPVTQQVKKRVEFDRSPRVYTLSPSPTSPSPTSPRAVQADMTEPDRSYEPAALDTPTVVGKQEIYRDPRERRLQAQVKRSPQAEMEKLTFAEKMRLFAKSAGEDTPGRRVNISSAQREIEEQEGM